MDASFESVTPPPVVIATAADEAYSLPVAVMAASLVQSAKPGRSLHLFVLNGGMSAATRTRTEASLRFTQTAAKLADVRLNYSIIDASTRHLGSLNVHGHLSASAYLRIQLGSTLPECVDRVIYIDCDTIIMSDLNKVFQSDMGSCICAGVPDYLMPSIGLAIRSCEDLDLDPRGTYFNSGFLVIDLNRWRNENIESLILQDLCNNQYRYDWHDQCGINAVLSGKIKELPREWNVQLGQALGDPNADLSRARIIHWTTSNKPWHAHFLVGESTLYRARARRFHSAWMGAASATGWFSPLEWIKFRVHMEVKSALLQLRSTARRSQRHG